MMVAKSAFPACLLLLLHLLLDHVESAAMDVHSIVGRRALDYYGGVGLPSLAPSSDDLLTIIRENQNAVEGGSDFPDFLYACGNYSDHHDAGEVAHWPVFQAAAVNYIRSQPDFHSGNVSMWTPELKKLTAFVFGFTVHYVTDELWEGLTTQLNHAGMIELVDGLNLGTDGQGDHNESIGNQAADFYATWILNQTNIHPFDRFFPVNDLVNIYHQTPEFGSNGTFVSNFTNVTATSLQQCRVVFDLGLWATQEFGPLLFPLWARSLHHVPFVTEHLFDQPLSGIEDLAAMTSLAWNRVASWLSSGAPPFDDVPSRTNEAEEASDEDDRSTYDMLVAMRPFVQHVELLRDIERGAVQNYFDVVSSGRSATATYVGPKEHRGVLVSMLQAFARHRIGMKIDMMVEKMVEKTKEEMVEETKKELVDSLVATIEGEQSVSYFGSQSVVGDFNADGYQDLCVSAYGTGERGISSQQGAVHCYYNWSSSNEERVGTSNVTIHGDGYRSRFGYAMVVLDFNLDGVDDLVVASPGYSGFDVRQNDSTPYGNHDNPSFHLFGRVYVLFGQRSDMFPTSVAGNKTTYIATSKKLRGLGQTLNIGDINQDGHDDLLIGCPLDDSSSGRLLGMVSSKRRGREGEARQQYDVDVQGVVDLQLTSPNRTKRMAWFGFTATVVSDLLLVGAPFYKMTSNSSSVVGAVHGYRLSSASKDDNSCTAVYMSSIVGEEHLEQFGYALYPLSSTIVAVSAPDAGSGVHSNVFKWPARSGKISILDVTSFKSLAGVQNIQDVHVVGTVRGIIPYARFGSRLAFSPKTGALFVSAPLQDTLTLSFNGREMGAVFGFHVDELIGNLTTSVSFWENVAGRPRARFGSSMVIVRGRLVVGSPVAEMEGDERVGVVDVFIP